MDVTVGGIDAVDAQQFGKTTSEVYCVYEEEIIVSISWPRARRDRSRCQFQYEVRGRSRRQRGRKRGRNAPAGIHIQSSSQEPALREHRTK